MHQFFKQLPVTICQKCGDEGFPEALIYCDECQDYAVHLYCLDTLPKTFEEYIVWLCVDCQPKVVKSPNFDIPSPLFVGQSDTESLKSDQLKKKNSAKRLKRKSKRKVNTFTLTQSELLRLKTNSSLQPREVDCSENGEKNQKLTRQNGLDEDSFNEVAESLENENSQLSSPQLELVKLDCCQNSEKYQQLGRQNRLDEGSFHKEAESIQTKSCQMVICDRQLQLLEMNCYTDGDKNQKLVRKDGLDESSFHEEAEAIKLQNSQLVIYGPQPLAMYCCEDGEKDQKHGRGNGLDDGSFDEVGESHKSNNSWLAISKFSDMEEQSCYVNAQPIKDPIWMGSIDIFSKNFGAACGLVAHLSSIACSRVREEAKSLPRLLSSKLLPRSAVWPKGFQRCGPSGDSIALYFFPDSQRNEKAFDSLVNDMISQDLAMRTVVENAELLIYSSTILPMEYWRFQAKFYLWGVFRGKQPLAVAIDNVGLTKTITWNAESPVSPLSSGSHVSSTVYQSESVY